MIAILFFVLIVGVQADEDFEDPRTWQCAGGVNYFDAPINYYYNSSVTVCFAVRKGCQKSSITTLYTTFEECMKKNFPAGRSLTKTFMCENQYYGHQIYTLKVGKKQQKVYPLLNGCQATERFCPKGYACYVMDNGLTSCCSITNSGNDYMKAAYKYTDIQSDY